ncbi:hypothetical protein MYX84_08150, partial [Acidobacteria bacterium AH-259-O06]|nr:hypothetical protein [Acidobacteria bacterium AH-259-O06]
MHSEGPQRDKSEANAASAAGEGQGNGGESLELAAGVSIQAAREELEKILASQHFAHAERSSLFLRFIVERAIQGEADTLKEYVLGLEVFDRKDSFDQRTDPVVRVGARRLRARLNAYYETEGRDDPILIECKKGSYVPTFQRRDSQQLRIRAWIRSVSGWKMGTLMMAIFLVAVASWWVATEYFSPPLRLKPDTGTQSREKPVASDVERPSLVVLPFVDLSPQKDQEYFCDGMTEELISVLARVPGLRVVSRTSAFQFKGKTHDVRNIGEQLNVSAVLEGSVRKAGTRLRITTQLINARDGYHLWSGTYEREMEDTFAIQDEISRSIVSALRVRLAEESSTGLVKRYTDNLEAYNLYLKGRYFQNNRSEEGLRKGIDYFEQAITKDPNYALAYAGLADSYALLASYGIASPNEVIPKAKTEAERALTIDDSLAEAHASLGFIRQFYDWDWEGAEREYWRAIELNPGNATAHHWYSGCLRAMGRLDEAMVEIKHAQALDPLSAAINRDVGRTYRSSRQHDQAIEEYKKTLEVAPNFASGYAHLGMAYTEKSMYEEAVAALQKARSLPGANPLVVGVLGYCYALLGKGNKAQQLLDELKERSERRYVSPISIVLIYIGLGEKDRAFEWLEKAHEERDRWLAWLKVDPVFDSLRSDPRFRVLLNKVG